MVYNLGGGVISPLVAWIQTHLQTFAIYKHALSVVNIAESFKKRGYIWPTSDASHIDLRELPGYQYDANDALIWFRPKRALESENANEQRPAKKQAQASLMQLWKKSPDYWQSIRWHFLFFACVLKRGGYKSLGGTDLPGGGL